MRNKLSLNVWAGLVMLVIVTAVPVAGVLAETDWWPIYYVMTPYLVQNTVPSNHPPDVPVVFAPSDAQIGVQTTTTSLIWYATDPDGDTVTYDVYLEADDATPDVLISQNQTTFMLDYQSWGYTTYYWQVVAKDPYGAETRGPVWRFTTGACGITLEMDVPSVVGEYVTVPGVAASPCANLTQVLWDWGDGTTSQGGFPASHTYAEAQGYTIEVAVSNDQGVSVSKRMDMYAGPPSGICPYVKQIPLAQCEALVALYEATGGANWNVTPGWMVLTNPCVHEWEGVWCDDDDVSQLYLGNKGLVGNVPEEIAWLTNLEELQLQGNNLWSLPADMQYLTKLTTLDIRNNGYLSGPIPQGFTAFTQMNTFAFSGTQLCVPPTGDVAEWLATVPSVQSTEVICP